MKSFVISLLLGACVFLLSPVTSVGQTVCKCRPSPPGGTTSCGAGQMAICLGNSSGECEGSCVSVENANLQPLDVAAAVLSKVLGTTVSKDQLMIDKDKDKFESVIQSILESDSGGKTLTFSFGGEERQICIGLPGNVRSKLKQASKMLEQHTDYSRPGIAPMGITTTDKKQHHRKHKQ